MGGFRSQWKEIPEHVGIFQMRLWVPLLCVDETREQYGIPDEEDRGVVAYQIPDTIFSVEFHGETSRIPDRVSRSRFTSNSGESDGNRGLLADGREDFGAWILGDVVGDFEVAEGSSSLGVDHSFGDSFTIKMGYFFDPRLVL